MNIQKKNEVYFLKEWNILTENLSGHYTCILDRRKESDVLYITKHGDFQSFTSFK